MATQIPKRSLNIFAKTNWALTKINKNFKLAKVVKFLVTLLPNQK